MVFPDKKLIVALTGGGTGGHIYPAVAVAQKLKTDEDIKKLYYIGCVVNMEKEIAQKENIEFLSVTISGMPRKPGLGLIKWLFELFRAVMQSIRHLTRIKPDVILGTGGYVSGPVLLAAIILKIPFVIHESDAHPGIANKLLAPAAKYVSVSFGQAKKHLNSKNIALNGNPVREIFNKISRESALSALNLSLNKKTLLVIGGSQGARTINNALMGVVQKLIYEHNFQIIHQTGKKNIEEYKKQLSQIWHDFTACSDYVLRPYFDDMSIPLVSADLAISRAGSLSISELNLSGLPSILIPYPYAASDHQRFNAKAMEEAEAAVYLEDSECNSEKLAACILNLFNNPDKLMKMKEINKSLAKPDSTKNIVEMLKKAAL